MKRLLLIGAGHAHAQVLKDWIAAPVAGCEVRLVSPHVLSPYSGMVPAWLAGRVRFEGMCIDFGALATAAGASFVAGTVAGLDADRRAVHLASGETLGYDVLSLDVGSTLTPPAPPAGADVRIVPLRPLGSLRQAWDALLADDPAAPAARPLRITTVGGGAAGVESLLAALARLRSLHPARVVRGRLLTQSDTILPGLAPGARHAAEGALRAAGVDLRCGQAYGEADARGSDLVLWATGAEAHAWQTSSGLAVDDRGFVRVDARLRSCSHREVHAAGDCAAWARPLPKAGVFAVRMGPVLSRNLRAALGRGTAIDFKPQRRSLALLATADGRAIASWGRWSLQGRWLGRLKDRIDQAFLRRFAIVGRSRADAPRPAAVPGEQA